MVRQPAAGYCQTCRTRRVKCGKFLLFQYSCDWCLINIADGARPHCRRCVISGLNCKGYAQPLRIQNHGVIGGSNTLQRMSVLPLASSWSRSPDPASEALQTEMVLNHFYSTYTWGPFWRPLLQTYRLESYGSENGLCTRALACSYMGQSLQDSQLRCTGLKLLGAAI